ncbi:hypothetical protein [Pseudolysinimonas sp.]
MAPALTRAEATIRGLGVDLPDNLEAIIGQLVYPWTLSDVSAEHPDRLVGAWKATRGRDADDRAWLVLLTAFRDEFSAPSQELTLALRDAFMNPMRTRIEVDRQLGSRAFHVGLHLQRSDPASVAGLALLRRGVELQRSSISRDRDAKPGTKRHAHGQIATASVHLARRAPASEAPLLLDLALISSLIAELHGDTTDEHFGYQAEIYARQFEVTRDLRLLELAEGALRGIDTGPARSTRAELHAARASAVAESGDLAGALQLLLEAEQQYTDALDAVGSDLYGYVLAKRGRARLLFYRWAVDWMGRRDGANLERALDDWLHPAAEPHRHGYEVARALIDRARLYRGRGEHERAASDSSLAVDLLGDVADPSARRALVAGRLADELRSAQVARDVVRLRSLLADVVALPADVQLPAAEVANVVRTLSRLRVPDWLVLAGPVLERLEADVDHPALSRVARGRVAGHAADVARLLDDSVDGLRRSLALYGVAIAEGVPSSARTLDRAARVAFRLAELLDASPLEGSAVPSEESLGLWLDCLAWSEAAIVRMDTTTSESGLDREQSVERAAFAARAVFDRTGDELYLRDGAPVGAPPSPDDVAGVWLALGAADRAPMSERVARLQEVAEAASSLLDVRALNLGGQRRMGPRGVWSLHDRHRLGEQVLVLKRTSVEAARAEFRATVEFADWLRVHAPDAGWRVPEPVGVAVAGGDGTYVMRRSAGRTIGDLLIDWREGRSSDPTAKFESATLLLAAFQAAVHPRSTTASDFEARLRRAAQSLRLPDSVVSPVAGLLAAYTGTSVAKKDAHPGNWIWGHEDQLILIDIESSVSLPVGMELVTLLDDLPLLPLTSDGWVERDRLLRSYTDALRSYGVPVSGNVDRRTYEVMAVYASAIALGRLARRDAGTSSRAVTASFAQRTHHRQMLRWLSEFGTSDVAEAARGWLP